MRVFSQLLFVISLCLLAFTSGLHHQARQRFDIALEGYGIVEDMHPPLPEETREILERHIRRSMGRTYSYLEFLVYSSLAVAVSAFMLLCFRRTPAAESAA